jgi:hypothetical protein
MPQGQTPLTPEDVAKLTAGGAQKPPDPQLAKALELVATQVTATR